MKSRALASIALGAALVLGTTGCSMISPQATTIHYAAAEGVNVPDSSGPVQIRNVFFVVDEDGTTANLVGAFVNETPEAQTATFQIGDGSDIYPVQLKPETTVSFGNKGGEQMRIDGFTGKLGGTVPVVFQSGGETAEVQVPVLDGTLDYLEDAVPEPAESPTPSATPSS